MKYRNYSLYLNKVRKNPAANVDRSPLIHRYGYASAGDRLTSFVRHIHAPHPFGANAKNRRSDFLPDLPLPSCNMQARPRSFCWPGMRQTRSTVASGF